MAAVRQRLGHGAHYYTRKTRTVYPLKSQKRRTGERAGSASSLSAGLLLSEIQNGGLRGADRVNVGVSQDSYTRLTPVFGAVNDVWRDGNVSECHRYLRHDDEYSPHNKVDRNLETNIRRCVRSAKFPRSFCTSVSASRRLCVGHGHVVFIRAYSGNGARPEPLYNTNTGYYDILEVTPSASHAQIKTAYYKQSFIYHPDRNAGSEAATVRFSKINEAYTVLGNRALKKKYDRGLLSQADLVATVRPSGKDTTGSSAKHQGEGRRSVMSAARQEGDDFDKFFKAHYSEQLLREKDIKEHMLKKKGQTMEERNLAEMMGTGVGFMLVVAMAIFMSLRH